MRGLATLTSNQQPQPQDSTPGRAARPSDHAEDHDRGGPRRGEEAQEPPEELGV